MANDIPEDIATTLQALKKNRFDAHFARTAAEARTMILSMMPPTAKIGIADSASVRQMGLIESLVKRGNEVINPFDRKLSEKAANVKLFRSLCRQVFSADIVLTGANAVTLDGKLISIDHAGNRVAATIFGAPKIILVLGRNKIVKDTEEAIHRIKNVMSPIHAKMKAHRTPCAVTGKCSDCDSPARLCNVTMIMEKKPGTTDFSVILVDEDLGLGWDPSWDEKRIDYIRERYLKEVWVFFTVQ